MISPFYIMFSQEMRFPFDLTLPSLAAPQLSIPTLTNKEQNNASLVKYVIIIII